MSIVIHMTRPEYYVYTTVDRWNDRSDRWRYAIEKLGFEFNGYKEVDVTSDDLKLWCADGEDAAHDHANKGDVLVLVFTDLPLSYARALWAMTGCVCCSVTKWNGGDPIHGDEEDLKVEFQ